MEKMKKDNDYKKYLWNFNESVINNSPVEKTEKELKDIEKEFNDAYSALAEDIFDKEAEDCEDYVEEYGREIILSELEEDMEDNIYDAIYAEDIYTLDEFEKYLKIRVDNKINNFENSSDVTDYLDDDGYFDYDKRDRYEYDEIHSDDYD